MKTTKGQRKKLYDLRPGSGWIVFNSGNGEITEIEIYVGRDNKLRRVANGKPLLPVSICIDDEGIVEVN